MKKKQRVLVFSGFLGSGKTTTMIETAKYLAEQGVKVALVTNDLGSNLVDTNFARMQDVPVAEIPNGCFCHDVPNLVATIDKLAEESKPDIVFAEPVGSCVDIVRNVYKDLDENFAARYELAPFTAVIDPARYQSVYMGIDENRFNEPVTYMYKKQLEEAEVLLLNKIDLIDEPTKNTILASLKENFPEALVIPISSACRLNYEAWVSAFMHGQTSRIIDLDIDWNHVHEAENTMAWYNKSVEVVSDTPADINTFTEVLMEHIRFAFVRRQLEIAHLKIICSSGDDYAKVALTGANSTMTFSRKMNDKYTSAKLNINIRALITAKNLEQLMEEMLASCAAEFGMRFRQQYTQTLDMFDHAPELSYVP